MLRLIIKLGDKYLEWSCNINAPVTYGMTLEQFKAYYKSEYGNSGMFALPHLLEMVESNGISSKIETISGIIKGNHAGENEAELSEEEIIKKYCQ